MRIRHLNTVILADDQPSLRDWWVDALELDITTDWPELSYTELGVDDETFLGIGSADNLAETPPSPRVNTALPQFVVDDVPGLLERVTEHGGTIDFGPSYADEGGYWYAAFSDPEGNTAWIVSHEAVADETGPA